MNTLIPHAALCPAPWKNGGGSTTEIAIAPPGAGFDTFDWRVSLATIAQSGPFSVFGGIDRTLALVDGAGVVLDIEGERHFSLSQDDPVIEFAGEAAIYANVSAGETTDFNVMTRRARCRHQFERMAVDGVASLSRRSGTTLLFLADGAALTARCGDQAFALGRYDALVLDTGTIWTVEAIKATLFVVDIISNG